MSKFHGQLISGAESARINKTKIKFPFKRSPMFARLTRTAKRAFSQAHAESRAFFERRNDEFFAKFDNV